MNGLKKTGTIYAAVLLLIAQLLTASVCYADENADEDVVLASARDQTLFVGKLRSWTVEETGSIDEDEDMVEADELAYQVLQLQDQDGLTQGEMWICAAPYDNSFYYCDTQAEAEEYFSESGDEAVETVMEGAFTDAEEWSRDQTAYLMDDDAYTYVIRQNAEVDGAKYLLYVTCDFAGSGGVHEVLLFPEPYDTKLCDRIAQRMQGYGYAVELIDNRVCAGGENQGGSDHPVFYDDNDTDSGIDFGSIFLTFISVVVLIFLYGILRNRVRDGMKGRKKLSLASALEELGSGSLSGSPDRKPAKRAVDKWTLKEFRKGKCRHEDMHIETGTRYSGYFESLRTLHKSGLLTTKEMNELMEKHKDDI